MKAQALMSLLVVCAKLSSLCYARHLLDEELTTMQDYIDELLTLVESSPHLSEELQWKPKMHQLTHLSELMKVWTGHLANVVAHESLNKVSRFHRV